MLSKVRRQFDQSTADMKLEDRFCPCLFSLITHIFIFVYFEIIDILEGSNCTADCDYDDEIFPGFFMTHHFVIASVHFNDRSILLLIVDHLTRNPMNLEKPPMQDLILCSHCTIVPPI